METQAAADLEAQYRLLRERAGLLDRSERGKVLVGGPEAAEYLQGQVSNDVEALGSGQGCYAALLSPKGKILADARVLRLGEHELWLDTEASAREAALSYLEMYSIGRQVEISDASYERAILSLIGPASREVANAAGVPQDEHVFAGCEIGGTEVLAVVTNLGLDLIFDREHTEQLHSALVERGAVPVSEQAAEVLRIESGRARYGLDMTDDNFPAEAGIEQRAVSFSKGCYVGQEPVARMHYRGRPNRHLRGLLLSQPASAGETLHAQGREVGTLSSTCVSPTLGPIGLALVRREVEPGEELRLGETGISAKVVELPFEGV